ncbi:TetR/AcrR family transcriptional regulator [Luteibacter yeojuensis]|uniref:TetR/AcrR family transcriptional regulator n=1 Tax=Luteibacter yeojuensis TaxID=345309 RepID=A0A7X5QVN0_9GAMM|nr:TetR/AcrR family transcriptional regulator [Luteibacter yeojuensis]NID16270.1 TetR/AcrR family transcriptional regulator [Luteibacter yeojuensis]
MARPREYDETKVLAAAADVFWAKGYEGASTRDLSAHTGLTASSIYAAFGDKRELFHRALDHYLTTTLRARIEHLDLVDSPSAAIRDFFADIVERSVGDPEMRGCMLINSSIQSSSDDTKVRQAIADEFSAIESFFERHLARARRTGEIAATISPARSSRHLLTLLLGIRVLARIRADRDLLTDAVREGLASVGIPFSKTSQEAKA